MTSMRIYELHRDGQVVERAELVEVLPDLFYRRTNPSAGDALLEERLANADETAMFYAPTLSILSAAEVAALPPNGNGPLATVKAILAKADADITAGEVKTVVLLMARYFLRKWVVEGWR